MNHAAFREAVRLERTVRINGREHRVKQIALWDPGLMTCWFEDGSVLLVDGLNGEYMLGQEVRVPFSDPYPKELFFQGKTFVLRREQTCTLSEVFGGGGEAPGLSQHLYRYESTDRHVLYLGRRGDGTIRDLVGKDLPADWVEIV